MNSIKLMVVEDKTQEQQVFMDSVETYQHQNGRQIAYQFVETAEQALEQIDSTYDGAIVDLKLGTNDEGGNAVVRSIDASLFRIPVIFVTGFPALVDDNPLILRIRPRAQGTYSDDLDMFFDIYRTGLTRIMGGRGVIEQTLRKVFVENLLPQLKAWIAYGKADAARTEKALLRFIVSHLQQLLDHDPETCFPEEMYICPPVSGDALKTGSVVQRKSDQSFHVVLTPACDLFVRPNGDFKTDTILVVEIESETATKAIIDSSIADITGHSSDARKKKKQRLSGVFRNNYTDYYHWLPKTVSFAGGFINFRKLSALSKVDFSSEYDNPGLQISSSFVKDLVSRFSSYYARQGQPDVDSSHFIEALIEPNNETA